MLARGVYCHLRSGVSMMCPHCGVGLRQSSRTDRRCAFCHKTFAFDPRQSPLRLNDLRLRRVIERLSDDGKLRYTMTQLWYGASRKTILKGPGIHLDSWAGGIFWVLAGSLVVSVSMAFRGRALAVLASASPWLIFLAAVAGYFVWRRRAVGVVRQSREQFATEVMQRWKAAYDETPRGLISDHRFRTPVVPDKPVLTVLSPEHSVLTCLAANGVPQRLRVALARSLAQVPPRVAVLVVHDASVEGCLLPALTRAALPGRLVLDAGLRPRSVQGSKKAVKLRGALPAEEDLAALRTQAELTERELKWLSQGWWSPVAAVRPAVLLARVHTAVGHVQAAADPARRLAADVGYLTWPSS
jgi:hypothetical protein